MTLLATELLTSAAIGAVIILLVRYVVLQTIEEEGKGEEQQ
jgi:hypothetical protein